MVPSWPSTKNLSPFGDIWASWTFPLENHMRSMRGVESSSVCTRTRSESRRVGFLTSSFLASLNHASAWIGLYSSEDSGARRWRPPLSMNARDLNSSLLASASADSLLAFCRLPPSIGFFFAFLRRHRCDDHRTNS